MTIKMDTITPTIEGRQERPSEPSACGPDGDQPIAPDHALESVQGRQEAVEDAQIHDVSKTDRSPPFARSSDSKSRRKPSLATSSRTISRVCYTKAPLKRAVDAELSSSKRSQTARQRCYTNTPRNRLSGIVLRDGLYYFRRRVPDALRAIIGRSEIWRSLRKFGRVDCTAAMRALMRGVGPSLTSCT